jgi:hypothetical protein
MFRFIGPLKVFTAATKPGDPFDHSVVSDESRVIFASMELKKKKKKERNVRIITKAIKDLDTDPSPVSIVSKVGRTGR